MTVWLEILRLAHLAAAAVAFGGGAALVVATLASDRSPDPWLAARPIFAAARWLWTPLAAIAAACAAVLAWRASGGAALAAWAWSAAWILGAGALGFGLHFAITAARDGRPPASIIAGRRHRAWRNLLFWIGGAATTLAFAWALARL